MNGNISNRIDGMFKKVKNIGNPIETSISLKKFISSKIFKIKPKQKNAKVIFTRTLKNSLDMYLFKIYDLIIFSLNSHI